MFEYAACVYAIVYKKSHIICTDTHTHACELVEMQQRVRIASSLQAFVVMAASGRDDDGANCGWCKLYAVNCELTGA